MISLFIFLYFHNPIKKTDFTLKFVFVFTWKKIGFWNMHNNKTKSIRILVFSA